MYKKITLKELKELKGKRLEEIIQELQTKKEPSPEMSTKPLGFITTISNQIIGNMWGMRAKNNKQKKEVVYDNITNSQKTMYTLRTLEDSDLEKQTINDHEAFLNLFIDHIKEGVTDSIEHPKYDRIKSNNLKKAIKRHYSTFINNIAASLDINVTEIMYEYALKFKDNKNEDNNENDED